MPVEAGHSFHCLPRVEGLGLTEHVVTGTLKGYDALMNLVLDDVEEVLRGRVTSTPRWTNHF
jgi:hypothetical protein